jgi:hypothetical protein
VPLPESSPDSAGPRTAWGPGLSLWGLLILTAAIYWPGLAGPLVLDDHSNLEPLMGMGSSIVAWQEVLSDTDRGIGARPLAMLT